MKKEALKYHKKKPEGKLEINPTKKMDSEWDLSLAYSPGVAEPCKEIHKDPSKVSDYTGRGNLIAVVSNGSAVLGLGDIGPLASKPVMEGKAVLFKKFADINVFDIELNAKTVKEFVQTCKSLEPTFSGINLEDIAAPECFEIEETLVKEMDIPVFHDDQHGTAIITCAAFLNACEIQKKKMKEVKIVFSGAGAAAISCARLLLCLGVKKENIIMCDSLGVIYKGRKERMNIYKEEFANATKLKTLKEVLKDADAFIGLSTKDILTKDMIKHMSSHPIIFAMANPDPEILPEEAKKANPNTIIATGRSDYPNQVNNVLGFPFIFRGALDVQAKKINREMKLAAVHALADLAKKSVPHSVSRAYQGQIFQFGADYIIPKPFDFRVLTSVAPAVAKAAMDSGVAQKPIKDFNKYVQELERSQSERRAFVRTAINRIRIYNEKMGLPKVYLPEGENHKILTALNTLVVEKIIEPVLIGDQKIIDKKIKELGLSNLKGIKAITPKQSDRFSHYVEEFQKIKKEKNFSKKEAEDLIAQNNYFASMAVQLADGDGMMTGVTDSFANSIRPCLSIIGSGKRNIVAGVNIVLLNKKVLFFADTAVNVNPTAEQMAHIAIYSSMVAEFLSIEPRVALLSFVNFSDSKEESPQKIKEAVRLVRQWKPHLKIEGEVQADIAVNEDIAKEIFPKFSYDKGANVLVFPNLDSGNIAYKLVQQLGAGEVLGPLLMGIKKPVNVAQRTCNVDDVINSLILTGLKVYAYRERNAN